MARSRSNAGKGSGKAGGKGGGGKSAAGKRAASPAVHGRPAQRPSGAGSLVWSGVRGVVVGLLFALVVIPGWAFFRAAAPYAVPLIVGAVIGLEADSYVESLVGSTVFSAVLAMLATGWLTFASIAAQLTKVFQDQTAIAQHFAGILTDSAFGPWVQMVKASDPARLSVAGVALVALIFSAGVSSGVLALRRSGTLERLMPGLREKWSLGTAEQVVASGLMVVVLLGLVLSVNAGAATMGTQADQYLQKGAYATDYGVYLRTIQDMARGTNYYTALKTAANDDARAGKPDHYNLPTASWVRMPVLPWLLAHTFGKKLSLALTAAIVLAAIGAGFVGWALDRCSFAGAGTVVALLVMPYIGFVGVWLAAFLADYWGGILILLAFGLLMNRLTYAGIVASVFAALTREQIWFWLFAVLVSCVWLGLARKKWGPTIAAGAGFALVVAAYEYHWHVVNTHYASILYGTAAGTGPMGLAFGWTGLAPALTRVNSVADFVTTSYTLYRYPAGLFILTALGFFAWRVVRAFLAREVAVAELAGFGFLGVMTVLLLAETYASQYWGTMLMPLALAATAGLVCEAIREAGRMGAAAS